MAYIKPKHYVWQAFCEIAKRERLTAAEIIERLQTVFPYEPVEQIVRAEGDMSKTLADVASAPLPTLSTEQSQQSQGSTNQQQGQQADPQDFNAMLRQRAGSTTVTLPREAITGVKGQGEYEPADDFVRARFGERYS
jgi:hypothetical protein